jgi:hypothetical protein
MAAGIAPAADAATHTAASCNASAVQSAINNASNGDTVQIPAGTCTWNSQLTITKGIQLLGAGVDVTVLVDNVPKDGSPTDKLLVFSVGAPATFRMAHMTIRGQSPDSGSFNHGHIGLQGSSKAFRVDHLKFTNMQTAGIRVNGDLYGVIDHNEFIYNFNQGIVVSHDGWGGAQFGDGSWAAPLTLGTEKAIYIEDNICTELYIQTPSCVDAFDGARVVIRYNTLNNTAIASHGTESSQRRRGMRSFEIYNNNFVSTRSNYDRAIYIRSGTGVVFNNAVSGDWNHVVKMENYRDTDSYPPWGTCNGSSQYDQNAQGGYRCVDQPGAGTSRLLSGDVPGGGWVGNILDPIYIWNNTATSLQFGMAGGSPNVQQGRDFFVGTARPGYTPYTYPHPLTAGGSLPPPTGSGPTPAPTAPSNVRIIR